MSLRPTKPKVGESVSTRVERTKKEIELLKNDLEKLLNAGTRPCTELSDKESEKGQEPAVVKRIVKVAELPKDKPAQKAKNYNVTETREFIKKQREKRAEELKSKINVVENRVDLKKQRLKELHLKTLELVTKNVQSKQERSRSTEKIAPVRLDRARLITTREKSPEKQMHTARTKSKQKQITHSSRERLQINNIKAKSQVSVTKGPSEIKNHTVVKIDTNFLYPPNKALNKTIMPAGINGQLETKKLVEHSIMTDACQKDSKETQTNQIEALTSLAGLSTLPYPYNFINTVKRKIQNAISLPNIPVDVAVQIPEFTPSLPKTREVDKHTLTDNAVNELQSFASHRCLDLKVIETMGLKAAQNQAIIPRNLFNTYDDSESDTSKNIPEISSESFVGSAQLSLDHVKELKLQKSISCDNYTSDFQTVTSQNEAPSTSASSSLSDSSVKMAAITHKKDSDLKVLQSNNQVGGGDSYSFTTLFTGSILNNFSSEKNTITVRPESDVDVTSESNLETQNSKSDINKNNINSLKSKNSIVENDSITTDFVPEISSNNSNKPFLKTITIRSKDDERSDANSSNKTSRLVPEIGSQEISKLQVPSVKLSGPTDEKRPNLVTNQMKNITIRPTSSTENNSNQIHLKFEAEVRLLNDFNESFKQFRAVEKEFEKIKGDVDLSAKKTLQNVDTQTSFKTIAPNPNNLVINFNRGSEITEEVDGSIGANDDITGNLLSDTSEWNLSEFCSLDGSSVTNSKAASDEEVSLLSVSNMENYEWAGMNMVPLSMFDQLIKEEDVRIDQLKAIIKIRQRTLLDRTKGELVWLEIQKKHLIETGNFAQASLLKKKQRGIIVKHEQERNEIKKLRQMQKEASEERKKSLRRQRNLIKTQLSTDSMLASKVVVKRRRERRSCGPLRGAGVVVVQSSESVHSEASISMRSSAGGEEAFISGDQQKIIFAKRSLQMRESALQKRRRAAEDLLRWHRRLLEEERKISELEAKAAAVVVVKQQPQIVEKQQEVTIEEDDPNYSSAFESEKSKISSISEIIEDLSKIEKSVLEQKTEENVEDASFIEVEETSNIIEEELPSEDTKKEEILTDIASLAEAIESASKIEESLNKLNSTFIKNDEEVSIEKSKTEEDIRVVTPEKKITIDVKKRVSEILADASPSRGDKSPRVQDLYTTAYDVEPKNLLEEESPDEANNVSTNIFGNEAEELWRKQLAIEHEIKQIQLQQKEQLPFVFMREIPNKPPPPYTPPTSLPPPSLTIVPTEARELDEIASYSSKVLFKAQQNNNLEIVKFSENGFKLCSKIELTKMCGEFIFNICRDLARSHYKQFEKVAEPQWLALPKRPKLAKSKALDVQGLERFLGQRLKEMFGFRKVRTNERAIIKWSRKKRDHVDEVLLVEAQEEEMEWTTFDKDELIVKSQVTEEIMKMLLVETREVFSRILTRKKVM